MELALLVELVQKQATKKRRGENSPRAEAREESVITLHPCFTSLADRERGRSAASTPAYTTIQF